MQGGQIYPSTDLYALAATCIRLATGKPIQELYDSYNNEWSWRSYTEISNQLDNVLERMLSFTPKHRFQSAQEVLDALQEKTASEPEQETLSSEAKTAQFSPEFIAFCQKELARYIGPMASLVCDEVIERSSFPLTLVGYVEALAAEIPDQNKANQFISEVKRNHHLLDG